MAQSVPADAPHASDVADAALSTAGTASTGALPDTASLQELQVLLEMHVHRSQPSEVRVALNELISAIARLPAGDLKDCLKADESFNLDATPEEGQSPYSFGSAAREIFLLLIIFPSLILLACLVLGALLASVEAWTWQTGFEYIVSTTCGLANPLGNANNVSPATFLGMTMAGVFGLWALGSTGILCGWASNTMIVNFIVDGITGRLSIEEDKAATKKVAALLFCIFVLSPLMLSLFVLLCACPLSLAERWAWADGNFYILANVAGLPNPLVQNTPATYFGKLFDAITSAWCFVLGSILIGLASSFPMPDFAVLTHCLKNVCSSRARRVVSPSSKFPPVMDEIL